MMSLRDRIRLSLEKAWDPTKHPRHAEGSKDGGQFKAANSPDDPMPPNVERVRMPADSWDQPKTAAEVRYWSKLEEWKDRQKRKSPARAVAEPPAKLGPGMLMAGVPKSWRKLGGKKEIQLAHFADRGNNDPRLMRITRWDDSQVVVIEKIPRAQYQSEVEAELENELLAGKLAAVLGAEVPHTEVSGIIFRQEFVPGKTLIEEMSDRLQAMSDDEYKSWQRQHFRDVLATPPDRKSDKFQQFVISHVDITAFPDLERRLEGVQNGLVDFLMDQQDRNKGNLFFGEDGHVILIDNGNTGRPGRTRNYSDQFMPEGSVLIEANAGKAFNAKQRAGLEQIKAGDYPEAVRFRADFLLRYGYIPYKELAAKKLWAEMFDEYQEKKKK